MRAVAVVLLLGLSIASQLGCSARIAPAAPKTHAAAAPGPPPAAAASARDPFRKLRDALGSVRRKVGPSAPRPAPVPPLPESPLVAGAPLEVPVGTSGEWSVAVTTARTSAAPPVIAETSPHQGLMRSTRRAAIVAAGVMGAGLLAGAILLRRLMRRQRAHASDMP